MPGIDIVKTIPDGIVALDEARVGSALAGRAVMTTKTRAVRVRPICFTISSKCLYYL